MNCRRILIFPHKKYVRLSRNIHVLLDFSLTVKAATLIFTSGRDSAILSAKEGNQVLFIIW